MLFINIFTGHYMLGHQALLAFRSVSAMIIELATGILKNKKNNYILTLTTVWLLSSVDYESDVKNINVFGLGF